MRCEGWRRRGGMCTLGPVKWEQCENEAVVNLTVEQNDKTETLPSCMICWNEAINTDKIKIIEATPI